MTDPVAATGTGSNSFFSDFFGGLSSAAGTIAKDILPAKVAQELNLTKSLDPTGQPTYVSYPTNPVNSAAPTVQKTGLLFDNLSVNATGVIVLALAGVAAIYLLKN
jgi:hypothetical protein